VRGKPQKPAWMTNNEQNPNRAKTQKEIMQEVIAKSKVWLTAPL